MPIDDHPLERTAMSRYVPFLSAFCVAVVFLGYCMMAFGDTPSADFRAVWMAGEAFANGQFNSIYPKDTAYFTMLPPPEWITALRANGYSEAVFPFIYPPLWAWISSLAVRVMTFETLLAVVRILNALMLLGMLAAARRMLAPTMSLSLYWLIGVLLLLLTTVGMVPLFENQPQILVAFLTVLAVERAMSGNPRVGGVLLACAAAIKLYPALYALLWLATGQKRAAVSFGATGTALGFLSLAVAGWPLHAEFLHLIHTISETALITKLCYAWESIAAQLFWHDQLIFIAEPMSNPDGTERAGWSVLPKPLILSLGFKSLQGLALVLAAYLFHRSRNCAECRAWLWPFAFALFSMVGPIAWSYHYLSLFAFVPALIGRMRPMAAAAVFFLCAICTSIYVPALLSSVDLDPTVVSFRIELVATCWITVLACLFLWRSWKKLPHGDATR